jgi:hypothetical protein
MQDCKRTKTLQFLDGWRVAVIRTQPKPPHAENEAFSRACILASTNVSISASVGTRQTTSSS